MSGTERQLGVEVLRTIRKQTRVEDRKGVESVNASIDPRAAPPKDRSTRR